jgi:hypothetical protein
VWKEWVKVCCRVNIDGQAIYLYLKHICITLIIYERKLRWTCVVWTFIHWRPTQIRNFVVFLSSVIPKFWVWNSNDFARFAEVTKSGRISTVCTERIAVPTTYFCSHKGPRRYSSLSLPALQFTYRKRCVHVITVVTVLRSCLPFCNIIPFKLKRTLPTRFILKLLTINS